MRGRSGTSMKSETALATLPAISILIEDDPFFARMREHNLSIVRRAHDLFKESGFRDVHDLEVWRQAVSEMLRQVPLKVTETDDRISVRAEVPGLSAADIEIKVDSRRVFITGKKEHSSDSKEKETVYSRKEFLRECLLPAAIDPEKVTAELKDGVLDIRLPKSVQSTKVKVFSMTA
jgi:HSP20 family molecular chaperone IbpA